MTVTEYTSMQKLNRLISKKILLAAVIGASFVIILFLKTSFVAQTKGMLCQSLSDQGTNQDDPMATIIFLETSTKSILSLREACVIESAAHHNQDKIIRVLSIQKFNLTPSHMSTVFAMPNVKQDSLNLSAMFDGTPLKKWHKNNIINGSKYPVHHLSDAARLAVVWKYGGIYLDTDALVIRPLKGFRNSVSNTFYKTPSNGVLIFDQFSPFLFICMDRFANDFHKNEWSYQGPELVTRVLQLFCNTDDLASFVNKPELCHGIRLLPTHYFLPVPWFSWKTILTETDLNKFNLSDSYSVHLYGYPSHTTIVKPGSGVLIDFLARAHCPQTYRWMVQNNTL